MHYHWIKSFTSKDKEYFIHEHINGRLTCSCEAYRFGKGKDCKHIILFEVLTNRKVKNKIT